MDLFTEDVTPQRTLWQRLFLRLTPTRGPVATEYPFDFTTEAKGLIRGLEAKVWLLLGRPDRAEHFLRAALEPMKNSESHAVDSIRLDLVNALDKQGREEEAFALLRARTEQETASPEILRSLVNISFQPRRPRPFRSANRH